MRKEKIAVSIDRGLLRQLDSKVDGSIIRSRSQAMELFLSKGLQAQSVDTAVIMIAGKHHSISLRDFKNKKLVQMQIEFFHDQGVHTVYVVTQHSSMINQLLKALEKAPIHVEMVETPARGNAEALLSLKDRLRDPFIAMSGDTFNSFDLGKMITKHNNTKALATMALMTRDKPAEYGSATLDGDFVIDFSEKSKHARSHIVNAGFYIFQPEIFALFDKDTVSLEKNIFPKIARIRQLAGFFTQGEYDHFRD